MDRIETIGRYIDGTLQDRDVHPRDTAFVRIPQTGRNVLGGWACDFEVLLEGQRTLITITVTPSDGSQSQEKS